MKKLLLLGLLALVACSRGTENYTPTPFSFAGAPPIKVNVAEIRVVDGYEAPLAAPHVDHSFPTPPAKAIGQWVKDRLIAAGAQGIMEVTIENASVREVKLPKKTGIEGWFTDDQDVRYDAAIKVSMRLYADASGLANATAEVTATRSNTINEKASVADRERLFDTMTRTLMTQFEMEAQGQLRQYFTAYLL